MHILRAPLAWQALRDLLAGEVVAPLAVVTMGNPWRGDDGAAIKVAERLRPRGILVLSLIHI